MWQVGDQVRISKGIYEGRVVEISRIVATDVTTYAYSSLNGYEVRGLTGPNGRMSTFWDDELEPVDYFDNVRCADPNAKYF